MSKWAVLDQFKPIVHIYAEEFKLDPKLILSIIAKESSGNPLAMKFEPTYSYIFKEKELSAKFKGVPDVITETNSQRISWGLMQLMGGKARELGFEGQFLSELLDSNTNIYYGSKLLKRLSNHYKDLRDVIASYNRGSPKKEGGYYSNQTYIDHVLKIWSELT